MIAKEISRKFDMQNGAVIVSIQNEFGAISPHTIYAPANVDATVASLLAQTDADTAAIKATFQAAGWQG